MKDGDFPQEVIHVYSKPSTLQLTLNVHHSYFLTLISPYKKQFSTHNGIIFKHKMTSGTYCQQEITGVFFRYCGLNYAAYRDIFPLWALGEYRNRVLLP